MGAGMDDQEQLIRQIDDNVPDVSPGLSAPDLIEISVALHEHPEAVAEIVRNKELARSLGCIAWTGAIVCGALGWVLWGWYALLIAVITAYLLGAARSVWTAKRIERRTDLNIARQEIIYKAWLLYRGTADDRSAGQSAEAPVSDGDANPRPD